MFHFVVSEGGEERISESLLENDSLCYLSSDFLADSYQEERELTVRQRGEEEKKNVSQTFPPTPPPPPSSPQSSRCPPSPPSKNEKDQVAVTVTEQT